MKKQILLFSTVLLYIIFLTPIFQEWDNIVQALVILVIVQTLWIGSVFPIGYSSLIGILLMSLHVTPFDQVMAYFGEEIIWLIFAILILSGSFADSGIAQRMSLHLLKMSRGNGKLLLFVLFMLMSILAFLIPSSVGRAGILISFMVKMIKDIQSESPCENLAKAFFIGINIVVLITGALVITSSTTAIYAYGIFQRYSDFAWSYQSWAILFIPPVMIYVLIIWILLVRIFPIEKINTEKVMKNINNELKLLGPMTVREIKMSIIMTFTVVMWFLEAYHPFSLAMIGLFGAILTMTPWIGVWQWKESSKAVDWEFLIFIAVNLAIANMLLDTGAFTALASSIVTYTSFLQEPWQFLVALAVFAMLLRCIFANNFGFVSVMIPLSLTLGVAVGGFPPVIYAMVVYLVGMPGYLFFTQGAVNIMTYRLGYYNQMDLLKSGIIAAVALLVVVCITAMIYWTQIL